MVDDEVLQTEILSRILTECEVYCANDGRTAIDLALSVSPDLILLDVNMPAMDGFAVCEALRSMPESREIPVIFLTGNTDPNSVARAFQAGAVDYVPKPYESAEIRERVRTHLELKKSRESLARQNLLLEKTVREQEIDINLAHTLLRLINGSIPRYIDLADGRTFFVKVISQPCYQQGGDHFLVRTFTHNGRRRTVVSLKDQSGHKVNCVLRSIACDLYHNAIIRQHPDAGPGGQATLLNHAVVNSGSFLEDDFFTGINLELDHTTLTLKFIAAGHPPMILIRDNRVRLIPAGGNAGANLPFCVTADQVFVSDKVKLKLGDRIILFTDGLTAMPTRHNQRPLTNQELADQVRSICTETPGIRVALLAQKVMDAIHHRDGGDFKYNDTDDDISVLALELEGADYVEEVFCPADESELPGQVEKVVDRMVCFLKEKDFPANPISLRMAVNEALVNAWRHGNGGRSGQDILVRWHLGNDFNFEVIDRGAGFDPEKVVDPTVGENIEKNSGRGIYIIRKLVSWLRWRDHGRHLIGSIADHRIIAQTGNGGQSVPVVDLWKFLGR